MDSWELIPPSRRSRTCNPSFSSSLLDAIYRSIDEPGETPRLKLTAVSPPNIKRDKKSTTIVTNSRRKYSSSTSSFCSSSSSTTDTDTLPFYSLPKPIRAGPPSLSQSERTKLDTVPPHPPKQKRFKDLKKLTSPSSPGAKLAGFINSLFTATSKSSKKAKITAETPPSSSNCSSARSCLSKNSSSSRGSSSSGGKRSVRFCPVAVVVGEELPAIVPARLGNRKSVVEELLRGFEMEVDHDNYQSDSSEDLFELDNLQVVASRRGGSSGGSRGFRDELPVYETTSKALNRAIAEGLVV